MNCQLCRQSQYKGKEMKRYGYDTGASHSAAIFELGSEAAEIAEGGGTCVGSTPGLVVGTSEWIWIKEDDARRICAALTYFSETETAEIERLAVERFPAA